MVFNLAFCSRSRVQSKYYGERVDVMAIHFSTSAVISTGLRQQVISAHLLLSFVTSTPAILFKAYSDTDFRGFIIIILLHQLANPLCGTHNTLRKTLSSMLLFRILLPSIHSSPPSP